MFKKYFKKIFLVYKIMGFQYLFMHLCHCHLLVCSPLPSCLSSLLGGLFPSPNSLPLCFHGPMSHICICICVYYIPLCIWQKKMQWFVFLLLYPLNPSLPPFRPCPLYIFIVFLYMYACVCIKYTSRSYRWDVRENMLYLYLETYLFQLVSLVRYSFLINDIIV